MYLNAFFPPFTAEEGKSSPTDGTIGREALGKVFRNREAQWLSACPQPSLWPRVKGKIKFTSSLSHVSCSKSLSPQIIFFPFTRIAKLGLLL